VIKINIILREYVAKYPTLKECADKVETSFNIIKDSYNSNGKLLICGNGGSAADSEHIVGELMKGFNKKRPVTQEFRDKLNNIFKEDGNYLSDNLQGALPAISLVSQTALLTAYSNDINADMVFAQQVFGYGKQGDVLLGLSTSGNSVNVVNAIKVAKSLGMKTIGITGSDGGQIKRFCDVTIIAPGNNTPSIQENHLPIYHALCSMLEEDFFE